jgi:hypothetical protein
MRGPAGLPEPIHVATNRRLGDQSEMEGGASWLRRQPGHKVTHSGQVGGDRFGIASRQSNSKLLKRIGIMTSRDQLSFPNFSLKRFSLRESRANFGVFSALYNEAERGDGKDMTENASAC